MDQETKTLTLLNNVANVLNDAIANLNGPENAFLRGECRKYIREIDALVIPTLSNKKEGNPQSEHVRKLEARFLKQGFSKKAPRD